MYTPSRLSQSVWEWNPGVFPPEVFPNSVSSHISVPTQRFITSDKGRLDMHLHLVLSESAPVAVRSIAAFVIARVTCSVLTPKRQLLGEADKS